MSDWHDEQIKESQLREEECAEIDMASAARSEVEARQRRMSKEEKEKDDAELANGKAWEWWTTPDGRLWVQGDKFGEPKWIPIINILNRKN